MSLDIISPIAPSRGYGHQGYAIPGPFYLSLTRCGDRFVAATSLDGKVWKTAQAAEESFPESVQLGVFAFRSTGQASVSFEDFTVEPLDTPKK